MKEIAFAVSAVLSCAAPIAHAGDAKHCVRVGSSASAQTLKNVCNQKIEVVWCHDKDKRGYRDGLCKEDGRFHLEHTVLEAGEMKDNRYSLPQGATIRYGACMGSYYTTKQQGMSGGYNCK